MLFCGMPGTDGIRIHTLGHSRHSIERFVELVRAHGVALIVDVRGQPFSRFNPQFNREHFKEALAAAGIDYLWRGDALSGRPKDPDFRGPDDQVVWDKLRHWPALSEGLEEVLARAGEVPLALVCAEEDPVRCHRRFLLTAPLVERGAEVVHIRGNGRVVTEEELRAREATAAGGQLSLFGDDGA